MNSYIDYPSPLGNLLLAAGEQGLRGIYFEQHRHFDGPHGWRRDPGHPQLQAASRQLGEYFAGRRKRFDVVLDLDGTPFQRMVWKALLALPFGATTSYQAIAREIANPKAVRAVGAAIGRNPVSIIVPCHRVVGVTGSLSGYAGGLERKRLLLEFEAGTGNGEMRMEGGMNAAQNSPATGPRGTAFER